MSVDVEVREVLSMSLSGLLSGHWEVLSCIRMRSNLALDASCVRTNRTLCEHVEQSRESIWYASDQEQHERKMQVRARRMLPLIRQLTYDS